MRKILCAIVHASPVGVMVAVWVKLGDCPRMATHCQQVRRSRRKSRSIVRGVDSYRRQSLDILSTYLALHDDPRGQGDARGLLTHSPQQ